MLARRRRRPPRWRQRLGRRARGFEASSWESGRRAARSRAGPTARPRRRRCITLNGAPARAMASPGHGREELPRRASRRAGSSAASVMASVAAVLGCPMHGDIVRDNLARSEFAFEPQRALRPQRRRRRSPAASPRPMRRARSPRADGRRRPDGPAAQYGDQTGRRRFAGADDVAAVRAAAAALRMRRRWPRRQRRGRLRDAHGGAARARARAVGGQWRRARGCARQE